MIRHLSQIKCELQMSITLTSCIFILVEQRVRAYATKRKTRGKHGSNMVNWDFN